MAKKRTKTPPPYIHRALLSSITTAQNLHLPQCLLPSGHKACIFEAAKCSMGLFQSHLRNLHTTARTAGAIPTRGHMAC